jgi:dienelactone hydrolase
MPPRASPTIYEAAERASSVQCVALRERHIIRRIPLSFFRGDVRLSGQLFRNTDRPDVKQPGIVVTGSWLTVKEQMSEVYAVALAERGYTAFTFDFTGFGDSVGEPRQAEIPDRTIADLVAAADFLSTLSLVHTESLAHLAVCASAQYGLAALARGSRVARFISVAGWYHDTASVAPFYGGLSEWRHGSIEGRPAEVRAGGRFDDRKARS